MDWLRTFKIVLIGITVGCFLSNCATQMPASEGLVFSDNKQQSKNNSFINNISGEMIGGVSHIIPFKNAEQAIINKFGNDSLNTLDETYLSTLSIPAFSISYRNRIALGSTVPPLPSFWQVDGTLRVFGQYYLTLNKNLIIKNTEIIFQRRLLYKNNGGISLGAFYRYDPLQLRQKNGDNSSDRFYITWFGLRSVLQTPGILKLNTHLRGYVNAGYVPELKTPLISVGISVVFGSGNEDKQKENPPFWK